MFSEQWSGTARLSAHAFRRGLNVGFPIDYRYGWNLNDAAHRRLIDEVNATFKPSVIHSAPDCRLYSKARKGVDAIAESEDKAKEKPLFAWLYSQNRRQALAGGAGPPRG